jgi:predicted transcriptional regulator
MKPFCEAVVSEILPAVRAMVATKLVTDYGFSQTQAARKMGVSQPAISQYKRNLRGARTDVFEKYPQIAELAGGIAARMASGRSDDSSPTLLFCEICRKVRLSGLGCEVHRSMDGSLSGCNICMANAGFYGGEEKRAKKQRAAVRPLTKFTRKL